MEGAKAKETEVPLGKVVGVLVVPPWRATPNYSCS